MYLLLIRLKLCVKIQDLLHIFWLKKYARLTRPNKGLNELLKYFLNLFDDEKVNSLKRSALTWYMNVNKCQCLYKKKNQFTLLYCLKKTTCRYFLELITAFRNKKLQNEKTARTCMITHSKNANYFFFWRSRMFHERLPTLHKLFNTINLSKIMLLPLYFSPRLMESTVLSPYGWLVVLYQISCTL